jgi:hypothetical protein
MNRRTLIAVGLIASVAVVWLATLFSAARPIPPITKPDQCMQCHSTMSSLDHAHPVEVFGCAKCHGGNRYATEKQAAHRGIVRNPSRLEHAAIFCTECHSDILKRINRSMMQTQSGILNVLKYQWGESKELNSTRSVQDVARERNTSSVAEDHFAKACAACHVNQDETIFDNPATARGGGCSDCHRLTKTNGEQHAQYTTRIPNTNCLKCHNRSNRIGLSYEGVFESEGYGTPYKQGKLSHRLSDGRSFYRLPADLHHREANMTCIDCHTEKGIMGDGNVHRHMEEAEDVKCRDCHQPRMEKADTLAQTLSDLNEKIPEPDRIAYTAKMHAPLYHVQEINGSLLLHRKQDGKPLRLPRMSDAPYHTAPMHQRLDCSACHAAWAPSCYGCHEVHFEDGKQFDWIKKKFTSGQWQEYRSFLRFEAPSLGIGYNGKVIPFAPGCQVIGTLFKDKKVEQFHAMAMAGWDPHTTQKESRTCQECHFDPATLGLGRGNLDMKDGNLSFTPFFNSRKSGMPFDYPIDAFVSPEGKPFQSTSRKEARSFNRTELHRIVEAYRCILCHDRYDDPIYHDFNASKLQFSRKETPCAR